MQIAIMGSGGIGGLCGARFAAAGADVLFVARGAHGNALRERGLRLLSALGDITLDNVRVTERPVGEPGADFVIFTVKGPDTDAAIDAIGPLVGKQTGIVSFQNGVEGIDKLAARYGTGAVLPGVTYTTAFISAPGTIQHVGTSNNFTVGEWDERASERVDAFCKAAVAAGLNMQPTTTARVNVWSKLVGAGGVMAATCLTRLPVRACVEAPETRQLVVQIMREVIAVAAARGVSVPIDSIERNLAIAGGVDPKWKTSMLTDLEAGKVIEADSIFGALHRMGQELSVPTPGISVAYRALSPFAKRRIGE